MIKSALQSLLATLGLGLLLLAGHAAAAQEAAVADAAPAGDALATPQPVQPAPPPSGEPAPGDHSAPASGEKIVEPLTAPPETDGADAAADDAQQEAAAAEPEPQEPEALVEPEKLGLAIDPLAAEVEEDQAPVPLADAVTRAGETSTAKPLTLLGSEIPPGTYQRLGWSATELFEGVPISSPVLVVNGTLPGPTLCLAAAIHGDELNGIEMVRRVMHGLNPQKLSGSVVGVPIVNLQGFRRGSRYLPDRRDLNRFFPGNPNGSAASRIAYSFFTEVVRNCDALVDLHTGSFERANLPQLRADLRDPDVVTLTQGFGATVILHSDPADGTLRGAATAAGIPTVTLEAGGPSELELEEVMHGVKGIETLLNTLGMVRKTRLWGDPEPVYYRSVWVRANRGGILLADVSLGSSVQRGDLLGTITDPMTNSSTNLYAPFSGRVIGMARNQVVMPGFAAFHVGYQTAEASTAGGGLSRGENAYARDAELGHDDYIDDMSE